MRDVAAARFGSDAARVLVVDDEAELRGLLVEYLTDMGFFVDAVGDGRSALACLNDGPAPRLIILDIVMKPMDGLGFLRELSTIPWLVEIPVIIWTAHRAVLEHPPTGAARVFPKPLAIGELVAAVSELAGPIGEVSR
jgi:DNA-binding response OmpR family regulator